MVFLYILQFYNRAQKQKTWKSLNKSLTYTTKFPTKVVSAFSGLHLACLWPVCAEACAP